MKLSRLLLGATLLSFAGSTMVATAQQRGVTKDEVIIGTHTDLSGPAASYGTTSTNAIRMKIDEVNAAGGIHGRKIRYIVEDAQYQIPRAVQAANKLIQKDNVFAIVAAMGTPMNNAVLPDQLKAGVPNLFPVTAARSMSEPFHKLKFGIFFSLYHEQIRAGVKYLVETKKKDKVCVLYQETDFGKEILEGVQDLAKTMKFKIVETATNRPTDTDFSAQITKLRAAGCEIVAMGVIVRDAIIPYATARKLGWTDVDFVSTSASFDQIVASAPGNATEGLYVASGFVMPYRDTASPEVQKWWDAYKAKFNADPNIGAFYGQVMADLLVKSLQDAGPKLTTDGFIKALENTKAFRSIFGGPQVAFGPNVRQGSKVVIMHQVTGGRFKVIDENVKY
ncbi:MAG: ABC transporter substrate-binding protein [Xanthobacteraceae bacterium]|nr:ABC transporter substrate-binding protein [Xanthobacteraceae bacterium]QYK46204.1 MAG: ABC transporter substrate-binding protein [Xanthobacteraceae bacterium]